MSQSDIQALIDGHHPDPFSVLGPHRDHDRWTVRAFLPGALAVAVEPVAADDAQTIPMHRIHADGLFAGSLPTRSDATDDAHAPPGYRLHVDWPGARQITADPYAFGLLLGDLDLHLLREGRHWHIGDCLGAHPMAVNDTAGVRFAVWAPNASRVSVVGDFNGWDGRRHAMRLRHDAGVWELFVPHLTADERYKFEVRTANGIVLPLKADPLARMTEVPPATASRVASDAPFVWHDDVWLAERARRVAPEAPISIYEVHAGSWLPREADGSSSSHWDALADRLIPYVHAMGFTHIEFLPVTEHPFAGSWGYQPLSLYAPTARFGDPAGLARLVDRAHCAGLGVILDWVPAHFPSDVHGLAHFDGTALYEHADPREGFHQDWKTSVYNLGRHEVVNFLIGSALDWLRRFHVDGLRVDAVASMLYRDYSRRPGEWVPNRYGGRENLEAIAFLQALSERVAEASPGAALFAEESTAWPGVSAPVARGGLGFDYKWNMGWMNDTLRYMGRDPVYRRHHHDDLTFGLVYAFSEHFVLPLSHDEVVHGKGSLIGRMPGDDWQKHANLRAYLGFMWTHPGKKLLFMGGEFAQRSEWNHDVPLPWSQLDDPACRGVQRWVRDLNRCYRDRTALHRLDVDTSGFAWVIGNDRDNSVLAYLRFGASREGLRPDDVCLVVVNLTPIPRHDYRIGVPMSGGWREVLNSDATCYGGSGVGNGGEISSQGITSHGYAESLNLTLPPLGCLVLAPER
ncbi:MULTISPECIES: 1,4-alpha-glucan branching protein GlgB [Pandoraea]|uniref:1,4-alpha-glucan branching protein GlgB n=1 Tax=Pandoraea sp. LA3 TaxID=2094120 RepID=UPI001F5CD18D|nr:MULTISPECIES: 1,4-alpha-glucan branching protein GlgB [Pandoraea]MCI3208081.1 1,4-alpha-glucan branching enzyme [Pandoraea sp. LA3]MDN4586110.1 1,4-alpha-glucan branching enzyme [Pandoraea capi]